MEDKDLTVERKALNINLDSSSTALLPRSGLVKRSPGTFSKQESAAGTVAKTISAYDMKFSDEIYGEAGRHVSCKRLVQMMSHEYELLEQRLSEKPGKRYFLLRFREHRIRPQLPKEQRMSRLDGHSFPVATRVGLP